MAYIKWRYAPGLLPLIFLILINDLTAGCLLHKLVDDTILTEIIPKDGSSKMSSIVNDVISWSCKNLTNINWSKTKEMAIVTKGAGSPFDALSFSNNIVEQVHSFKLLGVTILNGVRMLILFVLKRVVVCTF